MDDVISKEMMKNPPPTTHVLTVGGKQGIQLDAVFDIMRFSELNFLFRVTARVFHLVDDLKRWITDKESDTNRELRPEDLDNAELHWLRHIQSQSFKLEFQYLQGDRTCAAPIYV